MAVRMTNGTLAGFLFLLSACVDETPPQWEEVCVKQELDYFLTTFVMVNKTMMPIQTPVFKCVQTEWQCVFGEEFGGEKACAKRAPQ